ncbi:hypothetical protein BDN67DRAFT_1001905 [Paxillus ammoniavirescens]|nr:hypothetical protein BDN67DRAFT_1001905 [Paxillus ammoniavirescens]
MREAVCHSGGQSKAAGMWISRNPGCQDWFDATLAGLYGSTKTHDTSKKQEIMVLYAVPFPELAAESKMLGGEVDMERNPWTPEIRFKLRRIVLVAVLLDGEREWR